MNHTIIAIISFSIILPVVIGIVRVKNINNAYYPFLWLIGLAFLNELISFFLIKKGLSNAINSNVYYLLEGLLITYQFKRWQLFRRSEKMYALITLVLLLWWIIENVYVQSITIFCSYYVMFHSFLIVLMSITMVNHLLAREKHELRKNAIFVICVGFIVYFTNAVLIEAFYLYKISASLLFQKVMMRIMAFINLLTNLLYVFAVLWMPRRQRFSF